VNVEDEREFFRRSSELMGVVGPAGFKVLAYLVSNAVRVDGQLAVNTTCRRCGAALGMSPTTAGRMFEVLLRHGVMAGNVTPRGCRFTMPRSVLDGALSDVRQADQAA
jgi:hypothetical protein